MLTHQSESRGHAHHGWLESWHTFSFANYFDPKRMGFGALRVINDDRIDKGMGFGTHPHKDMEIITIPLEGSLAHKDSMGNESVIRKGEVQIMSAGTGIAHSEFNHSQTELVKLLQIWVLPKKMNVTPRYEQKLFSIKERKNKFSLVVSPDGREGSVSINQDAVFSMVDLEKENAVTYKKHFKKNGVYIFLISGEIKVDGSVLKTRDGAGIEGKDDLLLQGLADSEVLIMEVPL